MGKVTLPPAGLYTVSLYFLTVLGVNIHSYWWKATVHLALYCAEDTMVTEHVDPHLRDGVHTLKYEQQTQVLEFTNILAAFFFS